MLRNLFAMGAEISNYCDHMEDDLQIFDAVVKSIDDELNVTAWGRKIALTEFGSNLKQGGVETVVASHSIFPCIECSSGPDTFAVTFSDGDAMILCRNCAYCGIFRHYNSVVCLKHSRDLRLLEEE